MIGFVQGFYVSRQASSVFGGRWWTELWIVDFELRTKRAS